jgi:hypothetical protein
VERIASTVSRQRCIGELMIPARGMLERRSPSAFASRTPWALFPASGGGGGL